MNTNSSPQQYNYPTSFDSHNSTEQQLTNIRHDAAYFHPPVMQPQPLPPQPNSLAGGHPGGFGSGPGGADTHKQPGGSVSLPLPPGSAPGLVRRSPHPTLGSAAAQSGPPLSPRAGLPPQNGIHQPSYGYFHGASNSMDATSAYGSEVGSSTSNPLYGSTAGSNIYSVPQRQSSRPHEQTEGIDMMPSSQHTTLPHRPSSTVVVPTATPVTRPGHGDGSPIDGEQTSIIPFAQSSQNSQSNSVFGESPRRPPAPTFLPSRPYVQQAPNGSSQPHFTTMAPPRSPSVTGVDTGAAAWSATSMSGSNPGPTTTASRGIFGKWMAQILPVLDDGVDSVNTDGVAQKRPLHQQRFGHSDDDLPLLEELGIFPGHIWAKARAVLNPFKSMPIEAAEDTDLGGPILFAFSLAVLLILCGKIQFSAIYGLFMIGVIFFKMLLSLMQEKGAPLQFVMSSVGYGLLPTVLLALLRTFSTLMLTRNHLIPITLVMMLWSAWCGTTLVVKGLGMEEQRFLILYPMLLFYSAFDVLTIF